MEEIKSVTGTFFDPVKHEPVHRSPKSPWWRSRMARWAGAIIGALLLGSGGTYLAVKPSNTPEVDQVASIVSELSKLIVLPTNETPTLATVSDPEKLRDQAFFANAQKGFKVVVYSKAGKAILYDPFQKKIVEVAPVNLGGLGK